MARNPIAGIARFIPDTSPLARAGGARMLLRAAGGSPLGAAVLAAIARKESSFGAAGRLPRFNNYWGYGIHASPDVYSAPSVEAMASRVWKALKSPTGYYKGKGKVTLPAILNTYAPPSENDTALYTRQTQQWMREMGFNPNANVFTGATAVQPKQNAPAMTSPVTTFSKTPGLPLDFGALQKIQQANLSDILAGRTPNPQRMQKTLQLINRSLPVANAVTTPGQLGALPQPQRRHRKPGEGVAFHGTYGFPAGSVDTGRAATGGEGGDWGGSMPRALHLAKAVGGPEAFPWLSQKRSRKLTASGGISDHWAGSTTSYAVDLATSGAAGDKLFRKVINYLSALSGGQVSRKTSSGTWHNFNVGGYRYQVGWRVPGHYDHVHVGVKKL